MPSAAARNTRFVRCARTLTESGIRAHVSTSRWSSDGRHALENQLIEWSTGDPSIAKGVTGCADRPIAPLRAVVALGTVLARGIGKTARRVNSSP